MFKKNSCCLLTILCLCLGIKPALTQSFAKTLIQFTCVVDEGLPTTLAINLRTKQSLPIIRWQSQYFSNSGYNPLTRCQIVSERFQKAYNQNALNFITAGKINKLPVICATIDKTNCQSDNILFTLEPQDDPTKVLKQLFDVRYHSSVPLTRGKKTPNYPYVNVEKILQPLQENNPQIEPQPTNIPTTNPTNTPKNSGFF